MDHTLCSPPPSPPSLLLLGCKDIASDYIDEVLSIYHQLSKLTNLRPGPDTNRLLGRLVFLCCQTLDSNTVKTILDAPELQRIIPALRHLCSQAESELETHWAAKIAQAESTEDAWACLTLFPYLNNYVDLTRMELCAMGAVDPESPRSVAFIGSGPLPLTSLALLEALSPYATAGRTTSVTKVTNIDNCQAAIDASQAMCDRLAIPPTSMLFCQAEAGDLGFDLSQYDAVYLAALVGATQEQKERLIESVVSRMRLGSLLVTRSCQGLKTLLYPEFDMLTPALLERLEIGAVLHPYGAVVNSVIVARVKQRVDQR
ncbi:nicotianamine synthase 3 [Myriangium duriaei CBS 260.36]|uniref:Nicotianamine synthase 3 n=1 Tax=Myriangium duriaei CBS 260.36 TaxID=1168546 RepID=A0A9P4MMQ6_9PEZI|nr:nicotianamine synthase 3 [Myriangium duriaei CBS 260.36]